MSSPRTPVSPESLEKARESAFESSDDRRAHQEELSATMKHADEFIAKGKEGKKFSEQEKVELSQLVQRLESLLDAQLDKTSIIARMDLSDGSYDNAPVDLKLRRLLAQCRQINIGLNHWFGVRLFKRVSGWTHDFMNLLRIRWRQAKDYLKAGFYTVAIPTAVAAAGVAGWYMYQQGGIGGFLSRSWPRWKGFFSPPQGK